MAIQNDNTLVTKGDLKALYSDKIAPYLGGNLQLSTNVSDHYSTDEKVVGVWMDGKPLYQKTIYCGSLPNASSVKETAHNISNIENVINITGTARDSANGTFLQLSDVSVVNLAHGARIFATLSNICIQVAQDLSFYDKVYVTVQYTKTTDTPNSAITTPGCYDINFPNTWPENKEIYFGNGLYGQRFIGSITQSANGFSMLSLESSNISKLINCGGSWFHGSQYICLNGTNDVYQNSGLVLSEENLSLRTKSNQARTNAPYDVWVCYTK